MSTRTDTRQLFDVELQPIAGSRFQPTGFPDLGAAVFDRPERVNGTVRWVRALLLESPQSVANWLESMGWDRAEQRPVPELAGLPYVRVVAADDGRYLTSSRTEAHRVASAYIKDGTLDGREMTVVIRERLGLRDDTPLIPREIARAVAALDPLCLIHGVFFADNLWPGQPKIARAVTGFVEAMDVRPAISGGVKRDEVRHQIGGDVEGGSREGYGFVPFHRTEYTAGRILASFCIDLAQIDSYGLGSAASQLLATIARWEIRTLLDHGLRLRTACDLASMGDSIVDRRGRPLPAAAELAEEIRRLIGECGNLLGDGQPTEVTWTGGGKRVARAKKAAEEAED
ncbi:MAG: type I-G CRISPR-associated RAMP protein Csb1/Cas7g [Actinomycetota bacterium]